MLENLTIEGMAAEGKCIAKHEGKVVFVSGVAPGDIVDAKVVRKDKKFLEAAPIFFHKHSRLKVEPFCAHFGVCGGCKWQHIPYPMQLEYKQQQVKDALERIAGIKDAMVEPILPSQHTQYYRNKLEYTFTHQRWLLNGENVTEGQNLQGLGFHIPGRFDKVLDIQHCYHQPHPSNLIRNSLRDFCMEKGYSFYNIKEKTGLMRGLIIRTTSTGNVMVLVQFFYRDDAAINAILTHLKNEFPQITSLLFAVNSKANDTLDGIEIENFYGQNFIIERMDDLKFQIGPKSFYQTNAVQAHELYKIADEFAQIRPHDVVYDLYTGTGTIANFVARKAQKVIGIEYVQEAINDAKVNAQINNISNTFFYAGDMAKVLDTAFVQANGHPDVVITDPPRAGMAENVVKTLLNVRPQRIVYVSCNPATQARDLALLLHKYCLVRIKPVDMFPHTHHVESVALLELVQ